MKGCGCVAGMVIVGICAWFVFPKAGADKIPAVLVRVKQAATAWFPSKAPAEGIPGMVSRAKQAVIEVSALDAQGNLLGTGTAFFIRNDGTAVTNFHVIEGASRLVGLSNTGAEYRFERVINHPAGVDLAILKFSAVDVPYLTLSSSLSAREGERVLVIGNPKGLQGTVSDGLISAFREDRSVIQISAPLSPGSSGSPVLNEDGQVIGVAFLQLVNGQNLNFAIASEEVEKAELGAVAQGVTPTLDAVTMCNWGVRYEKGQDVARDLDQARVWYQKAADAGNGKAMYHLGRLYERGRGVIYDLTQARQWYEKAADAGNTNAMARLGYIYYWCDLGEGVLRRDKAHYWYQKAADAYLKVAEAGDVDAMNSLGLLYAREDTGADPDYARARYWYQKAADAGNADAMTNLGFLYDVGHGVAEDRTRALSWYQKAANAGSARGMTWLSGLYAEGRGVAQDDALACAWLQKAVDAGNAEAMMYLANLYDWGKGVAKDSARAEELRRRSLIAADDAD